jgi:hypothetical protein
MRRKSVPLSLLHLAVWTDSVIARHDTAQRLTLTQRHRAGRRGNDLSFKAITKAAALEVIQ